MEGCGAPQQSAEPVRDSGDQVVVTGRVLAGDEPVGGAYVRLLDSGGEFTAEVVSAGSGDFRFYAAPGAWRVRALHRAGTGEALVTADGVGVHRTDVVLS
ncbi:DUF1416 domain-containing protein [Actinoalloteichus spitiensis]|uniref:DUF1416 domain-containing protein n=1 Tax=Actinoalloteichus spitiensis TaxID=252394 RepID=UPI00037FB77F|nr:DUF1416 domain-containing protein [Actinoalloteichus spitiensis]